MIIRRSLRRHRPALQALQALPAEPLVWPARVGVAVPTVHIAAVLRARQLGNELIIRGQVLRGDDR